MWGVGAAHYAEMRHGINSGETPHLAQVPHIGDRYLSKSA
jgi:hypothetical protein